MKDNALQVFMYNGKEVRTIEIDGETWFVAKDVCDILEIVNHRDTMAKCLDEDEKRVSPISTPSNGGYSDVTLISEAGLYTLLMRSNKPEAKPFRRWVTHDVLPTIRKIGSYSLNRDNPALLSGIIDGARIIIETAGIKGNQLALALDKMFRSYTGKSALQTCEIALTAPTKHQILTPAEIGKHFGLNAQHVNEILAGAGYQHKINDKWEALPPGEPYAVMQDVGKKYSDGTPIRQLKWDSSILTAFSNLIS